MFDKVCQVAPRFKKTVDDVLNAASPDPISYQNHPQDEKVTKLSMRCVSSGGGRTTHLITIPSLQPRLASYSLHPIRWPRASNGATYSSVGGSLICGAWLSKAVLMQKVKSIVTSITIAVGVSN